MQYNYSTAKPKFKDENVAKIWTLSAQDIDDGLLVVFTRQLEILVTTLVFNISYRLYILCNIITPQPNLSLKMKMLLKFGLCQLRTLMTKKL